MPVELPWFGDLPAPGSRQGRAVRAGGAAGLPGRVTGAGSPHRLCPALSALRAHRMMTFGFSSCFPLGHRHGAGCFLSEK